MGGLKHGQEGGRKLELDKWLWLIVVGGSVSMHHISLNLIHILHALYINNQDGYAGVCLSLKLSTFMFPSKKIVKTKLSVCLLFKVEL